jgi:DNA polymerase III delta prime subunit
VNVLLYGPPGTGKTELAKVCAREAGLELYEVEYADRDGHSLSGRDRYRSLQISQVFLKGSPMWRCCSTRSRMCSRRISRRGRAMIARIDSTGEGGAPTGSVSGKAWVNQILETNPVPVVWITNRIEQIDPAFRRRFQYHLELKSPPPGARLGLVHARCRRSASVSGLCGAARRARRADAGADPHRGALRPPGRPARGHGRAGRGADPAPAGHADRALGRQAGDAPRGRGHPATT